MSPFDPAHSSGAPTYTAVSASLSLSGLDDFAPLTDSDMAGAEWYGQDPYHHAAVPEHLLLSRGHEELSVSAGFGYASHNVPVSEGFGGGYAFSLCAPLFISYASSRRPRSMLAFNRSSSIICLQPLHVCTKIRGGRVSDVVITLVCTQSHVTWASPT